MIERKFAAALLLSALLPIEVYAKDFSTSVLNPAALPANGVVAGDYPTGGGQENYYFAVDLKPGALASQISAQGGGKYKTLTLALLDSSGAKREFVLHHRKRRRQRGDACVSNRTRAAAISSASRPKGQRRAPFASRSAAPRCQAASLRRRRRATPHHFLIQRRSPLMASPAANFPAAQPRPIITSRAI